MLRSCFLALALALSWSAGPSSAAGPADLAVTPLAMSWDWDWDEFRKFWSKQLGKTTGVVGTVSVVVVIGMLIVMSAKKKT